TVAQLTGHLTSVYGWVAGHVGRGVTSAPEWYAREPAAATVEEFDERFAALVSLLDALDPEMPAWNWAPQSKRVAFWHRRMAHERRRRVAGHRHDPRHRPAPRARGRAGYGERPATGAVGPGRLRPAHAVRRAEPVRLPPGRLSVTGRATAPAVAGRSRGPAGSAAPRYRSRRTPSCASPRRGSPAGAVPRRCPPR